MWPCACPTRSNHPTLIVWLCWVCVSVPLDPPLVPAAKMVGDTCCWLTLCRRRASRAAGRSIRVAGIPAQHNHSESLSGLLGAPETLMHSGEARGGSNLNPRSFGQIRPPEEDGRALKTNRELEKVSERRTSVCFPGTGMVEFARKLSPAGIDSWLVPEVVSFALHRGNWENQQPGLVGDQREQESISPN